MDMGLLLPDIPGLHIDDIVPEKKLLMVSVTVTQQTAFCPKCRQPSLRVHSRYERSVSDLPWAALPVCINLSVRRFFCDHPTCKQRIFCERLGSAVSVFARRTSRLVKSLEQMAFHLGGEAGARLMAHFGIMTSPATLLRLIRHASEPDAPTPRVLGVDDWAKRKGQSYGTILIDLERRQPVDLLPESTTEALCDWLKAHPGIEIVSRDRSPVYIDGIDQGAPQAVQVADRFHLLQNLFDTLKRLMERHPQLRKQMAEQVASSLYLTTSERTETTPDNPSDDSELAAPSDCYEPCSTAQIRFDAVKALQQKGMSQRLIATTLRMNRGTVRLYLLLDHLPERAQGIQSTSKAQPFLPYLRQRLQEGIFNRKRLFLEIRDQGFTGSYLSLWRALRALAPAWKKGVMSETSTAHRPIVSARQAAWLLLRPPNDLKPEQHNLRTILCSLSDKAAHAAALSQTFVQMIQKRLAGQLDDWLENAETSAIREFKNFAASLRQDYKAVKAALTLPWSNGQTEGQVHRLKLIKRQMYGRANFDLLRRRVLHAS